MPPSSDSPAATQSNMGHDGEQNKKVEDETEKLDKEEPDHEQSELRLSSGEEETLQLENDLQKLNALQYLLKEGSFEELNHEVAVIKEDPTILPTDNSIAGLVKRKGSSVSLRLREFQEALKESKLADRGRKLRTLVDDKKLRSLISAKKKQLDEKYLHPRFIDRCAFFIGILVVCITEFFILRCPHLMYIWYTCLIFPLMAIRFFMYHKMKFHYFMLDFCYLCQFLLLFYLFGHTLLVDNAATLNFFKLMFCFSNGPLAWGTIVWRNRLVFHDVDKLTSVFIHLCPPLVTYCLRWHTPAPHHPYSALPVGTVATPLSIFEAIYAPLIVYATWQVAYYVKTELIDRKKLQNDKDIMTSSRWMTVKEPHPIYKWAVKRGYKGNGVVLLMLVQLLYTAMTLLFLPILYRFFWVHTAFLGFVFFSVLWGGASYYFESFSESYNKRLEKAKHPVAGRRVQSFSSSMLFFGSFLFALGGLLKVVL